MERTDDRLSFSNDSYVVDALSVPMLIQIEKIDVWIAFRSN